MHTPPAHLALPIQWDLLETHLNEAAFLWGQWERALASPDYVLGEVAELESRLLAHLDALVLGGTRVVGRMLEPALADGEPLLATCAAFTLLTQEENREAGEELVLRALLEGDETQHASLRRALQLVSGQRLDARLRALLVAAPAQVQATILEVLGFWQADPGPVLEQLLIHDTPEVRAAALRAARAIPRQLDDKLIDEGLRSPVPFLREAALEAGLILNSPRAWNECRRQVEARSPGNPLAMQALAMAGGAARQRLLLDALAAPGLQQDLLKAIGFLGTVEAAQACLSLLDDVDLGAQAGEAFSLITGLSLAEGNTRVPPGEEAAQEETAQELPLPDATQVLSWWKKEAARFEPGQRYLQGQPFGYGTLLEALQSSSMYRRRGLALELALRSRGSLTLRHEAFSSLQQAQLAVARRAPSTLLSRSLGPHPR